MNLNRISIGGGLALVAVGLLANAAASLVGTPDRIVHADGMKRADKRQRQEPVADVVVPRQDEGQAETMTMGAGEGCVEVAPQQWFGGIRELPNCLSYLTLAYDDFDGGSEIMDSPVPLRWWRKSIDVNGDGKSELMVGPTARLVENGVPRPIQCFLSVEEGAVTDGRIENRRSCVLDTADLRAYAIAIGPTYDMRDAFCRFAGWRDMDIDGDQDLLVVVWFWNGMGSPSHSRMVWLENTGFEKQQFAAGDINQDGNVDGVDISILLSDWSY